MSEARQPVSAAEIAVAIGDRLDGRPLAVMLDVDGTLAPIAPRPQDAAVPPQTARALASLSRANGVCIAAISGRGASDAARLVGVPGIWVVGNHGMETQSPDGQLSAHPDAKQYESVVSRAAAMLEPLERSTRGVLVENKRWTLSVHYRLALDSAAPAVVASARDVAQQTGLRVTVGKKVVELRPPVTINKGTAACQIAEQFGAFGSSGSVLFAGDDLTDEDAFRALRDRFPRAVTVRVGHDEIGESAAEFLVDGPPALRELLEWLASRAA